jgi:hypothetical protein
MPEHLGKVKLVYGIKPKESAPTPTGIAMKKCCLKEFKKNSYRIRTLNEQNATGFHPKYMNKKFRPVDKLHVIR